MTNQEAIKMLTAKVECIRRETSGTDIDCNLRNCDGCELCYAQGTTGEQRKALNMAISALKVQTDGNCISRQAAIDALWEIRQEEISDGRRFHNHCSLSTAVDVIKDLPSTQPEIIHCRDCRYSTDFYQDGCCYCKMPSKEMRYIEEGWDFYCAAGKEDSDEGSD